MSVTRNGKKKETPSESGSCIYQRWGRYLRFYQHQASRNRSAYFVHVEYTKR